MKRIIDLFLCIILFILLFIPVIFIIIIIKISSPGPTIFWSKRIGKFNKPFYMPKFRSMYLHTPEVATDLLNEPDQYITKIGKILRKSSLDEVPQIYSIFVGDMSFIGPRPALFNQHELIEKRIEKGISRVKPGLTGWAQINGRDNISDEDKVKFDKEYIDNYSLSLDLKILYFTFIQVFKKRNISH